jgi:type IV pilus assembly protein PilY1
VKRFFSKLFFGLVLMVSTTAHADDLDLYLSLPSEASKVPPNVLFVLDVSGSMGNKMFSCGFSDSPPECNIPGNYNIRKLQVLIDVMVRFFNNEAFDNVNAGVTIFSSWGAGYTIEPIVLSVFEQIGENRKLLIDRVKTLFPASATPLVNAFHSAVSWFEGDFIKRHCTNVSSCLGRKPVIPPPEASPISGDTWCQPNHIVLLTDGEPTGPGLVDESDKDDYLALHKDPIEYPPGSKCVNPEPFLKDTDGVCAQEIAKYAFETDFAPDIQGEQNIVSHTIAFALDDDANEANMREFLSNIATKGGGQSFVATSASSLEFAIQSVVTQAVEEPIEYSYSSPAIPFNRDNAALSADEIYVPMFKPEKEKFWKGNLKKYALKYNADGSIKLEDAGGKSVVNSSFQFVSSQDFWGKSNDDADPLKGGVAGLRKGERKLYTYIGDVTKKTLTDPVNLVADENAGITKELLNIDIDDERKEALDWISWADGATHEMGAPLHSQPQVVAYKTGNDLVLMLTSEGVLEAIDAETGLEKWAFMPKELLSDIKILKKNIDATRPHYGLDGGLTVFEQAGKKYAVFGMRRGGKQYFALDITAKDKPIFAWQIDATGDFSQLGQTWSKPQYIKVHLNGVDKDVLVFTGGYDTAQDLAKSRKDDDEGNAIYFVEPSTGKRLMLISNDGDNADLAISEMKNSIPGDVLTVDINGNSVIDRLYAADVGGRIIRIDIPDSKFEDKTVSGGVIADVNIGGQGGYQRFYNTPEVGYFSKSGLQYLMVMVGSGFRPDPTESKTTDRFYLIKDMDVWTAPKNKDDEIAYEVIQGYDKAHKGGDLYNASENLIQTGTQEQMEAARTELYGFENKGWFFDLAKSEKAFSRARLFDYTILFTTYSSEREAATEACGTSEAEGNAKFYAINLIDATPSPRFGSNNRAFGLNIPGLPPAPSLVFPGGKVRTVVGLEEVGDFPDTFRATYWEEVIEGMEAPVEDE